MKYMKKFRLILLTCLVLVSLIFIDSKNETHALDVPLAETTKNDGEKKTNVLGRKFTLYILTRSQQGYETVGGAINKQNWDNYFRSGSFIFTPTDIQDGYRFVEWQVDWGNYSLNSDTNVLTISSNGNKTGSATAVFEFIGFETTYSLGNGGTFNANNSSLLTARLAHGQATAPEYTLNPGYHDLVWSSDLNIHQSSLISASYTVDVAFDSKNGSDATVQSVVQGETVSAPAAPTRAGYNFLGWYTDETYGTKAVFPATIDQPVTYYALWEASYYTIDYHANGGAITGSLQQSVQFNQPIGTQKTAKRAGYTLMGWNTESDGSGTVLNETSLMPANNITLYAQWKQDQYTISFNANGGVGDYPDLMHVYGDTLAPVADPSREGYEFLGWKAENSDNYWNFSTDTIKQSTTLIAQYREIEYYDVTFDAAGGNTVAGYQDILEFSLVTQPENPGRTGYQFAGWYTSLDYTKQWDFAKDVLTADVTLYAKWNANKRTVSFDKNGAWTSQPLAQVVNFGTLVSEPHKAPNKIGYVFTGWHHQGAPWNFMHTTMVDENLTLQAQYEAKTYGIEYIANAEDVTGLPDKAEDIAYESAVIKPVNNPVKEGYVFIEWNTQPNGAGQSFDELFAQGMVLNDVKLYAQWEENE